MEIFTSQCVSSVSCAFVRASNVLDVLLHEVVLHCACLKYRIVISYKVDRVEQDKAHNLLYFVQLSDPQLLETSEFE